MWGYKLHGWHMGNSLLVAGPKSSHQSKSCFGCTTDDKECKVFECSHGGSTTPWKSCSVTSELFAGVAL
jgi:hypothetical protein